MSPISADVLNPGRIEYDRKRREKIERYKTAVKRARFLDEDEKRNWIVMGSILNTEQLEEAENLIIDEDLARLKERRKIESPDQKPTDQ
jgi:hypothetical protein